RHIKLMPTAVSVRILGDQDKLKQVFINLIRNACEAVLAGDTIKWEIDHVTAHYVCIKICNGGEPIPADILPNLTQPFCSTKPDGTGLGLAITKRIVQAHGGTLAIQSAPEIGTIVSLKLPVTA
ncbi:MAG TPA: ATP-binding protein, partial [Crinalium sp.]